MVLIKLKPGTLILYLLLFSSYLFPGSKPENINFEHLSLDQGAALNLTYCMIQDHKGFLWFGTMYGLVKYDGKDYKIYKNDPEDPGSISFDDIISLYEDTNNNIWIGTWGGGLNKLDPETGKFTRFLDDGHSKNNISDNIVWSISEDKKGYIWFGTETSGLDKYDPEKNRFVQYVHNENDPGSIPENFIRYIYRDHNGTMWICSRGGLSKYLEKEDSFVTYKTKQNIPVSSVVEDMNGTLWIGTADGVYILNESEGLLMKKDYPSLKKKFIHTLCIRGNYIWLGTNDGLYQIDPNSDDIIEIKNERGNNSSLSGNNVLDLIDGSAGILWVNSYGRGINKLRSLPSKFTSFSNVSGNDNSLSSNFVTSFCSDENNVWVGTRNGLNKFNRKEKQFERFYDDRTEAGGITSLLSDGNIIWIGTVKGLKIFNKKTQKTGQPVLEYKENQILSNAYINSLLLNDGKIFIGTAGFGLFVYSPGSDSLKQYKSDQFGALNDHTNYILTLYRDNQNNNLVWIGTYGGLIRMDCTDNTFKIYSHRLNDVKSLSNNYVFSILRDSFGTLWVGTANGLNKFNETSESFSHIYEKNGLPNSVISSITEDKNRYLWVSTNYGVSQFNPVENNFINYNRQDGLLNNFYLSHSALIDKNGNLFLGGTNGLDIINTSVSIREDFVPGVFITSLRTLNDSGEMKDISTANDIDLNYYENFIDIGYISLDYNNPGKNRYKYRLEGIDENWIDAGNKNHVSYNSLPPGKYTFRVKGSSSSGIFNPNEAVLNFTILPPFWKTSWFTAILILILGGSAYLIYRLRVRQKIKYALELEKVKEMESERLRRKTAEDFHDELGHRLTRISLLSEILKRKIGSSSVEIHEILDKISENSTELYEGTKDFIWAIDPRKDSLYELIIRLKDFGDELFGDSDIFFEVSGLDESLKTKSLTTEWKRHLPLIFKEGMNNALKHGMSKRISITSTVKDDEIELTLTDDGRGFVPEFTAGGNGLRNMKRRAEKLSAKIEVDSAPGSGTKIFFRGKIPGKQMHYN